MATVPLSADSPILEENLTMADEFSLWTRQVTASIPIIGTGSPEGVVTALQFQLYIDDAGAAGAIEYRKMLADIGGDKSQGWVLV